MLIDAKDIPLNEGLEVVAIDCGNDNVIVPGPFVILTWSIVPVKVFLIGAFPVLPTIISPLFKTISDRLLLTSIIGILFETKKKPTKEEALKMLSDTSKELKQILDDVREDEMKLSCMQLKRVPEMKKETISNLEEDLKEIDEQCEEIKLLPDGSEVKLK